jgi:hypothetical protein
MNKQTILLQKLKVVATWGGGALEYEMMRTCEAEVASTMKERCLFVPTDVA